MKTGNDNYIKYCRFFSQYKFLRRLTSKFKSKKLTEISKYLKDQYNLLPSEVITASVMTFILLFIPLFIIFSQINIILTIILPVLVAFFVSNRILNQPINSYNEIQYTLLKYSDLAFQDLLLILNTTNSVFNAIDFVSKACYPILSEKFQNMLYKINRFGISPELLINGFIETLPNGNLRERLVSLMAAKFLPSKIQSQLESLEGEKKSEYTAVTRNLESKLTILVGICLFIPVLTALFTSFTGYVANFIALAIIPIFVLVSSKIKARIIKSNFELFGETSILDNENSDNNFTDLIEFLNFLIYFINELKLGKPQELALFNALQSYTGKLKPSLEECCNEVCYWGNAFKNSWLTLKTKIKNSQINFLIDLIDRMLSKSSLETGARLTSVIYQLNANRELIQEREGIIKAQQLKIKMLVFVMAGILGLISGLTPLLIQIFNVLSNPEISIEFNPLSSLLLWISLFIMTIYSAYFLAKLVRINRPIQYSFWTGLTFIITCYFMTTFFI
ncbi:MAG: hypothetical protein ACFFD2_10790 [Promethearchaeota archaeon]